jgi:hypothetical protein
MQLKMFLVSLLIAATLSISGCATTTSSSDDDTTNPIGGGAGGYFRAN